MGKRKIAGAGGPVGAEYGRWRAAARPAYLVVLLIATLSGLQPDPDPGQALERLSRVLRPDIVPKDAIDAARNAVLFAGWGLVWLLTAPVAGRAGQSRGHPSRPGPSRAVRSVVEAVLSGAAISLGVEVLQLLSFTRTPSVLDLATNTGGALLGALTVVGVQRVVGERRGSRSYLGVPAAVLAASYAMAVLGEALIPLFRQATVPGATGDPVRRFVSSAAAFREDPGLAMPWWDLPLFLPAGVLGVLALAEEGFSYRVAAVWIAVAGFAAMTAMELGHGVLGLPMATGSVLLHGGAIAMGAALAARAVPPWTRRWRGAERARWAAAGYVFVVLLWVLRPYTPELDPEAIAGELLGTEWWKPLGALAIRSDLYSVMDVVTSFFLYLPLGTLLAVWPVRRRGALRDFLPAVYLAATAEAAQLFVAGRTLDITDVLVNAAGVVVGWVLLRRAGLHPRGEMAPGA